MRDHDSIQITQYLERLASS